MAWREWATGLVNKIIGGGKIKSAAGITLAPIYGSGLFFSHSGMSQERLIKEAKGWAYACISKIAEEIGSTKLRLYRSTGASKKEWKELEDHPLLDLLDTPSPQMPRFELFQIWSMHDDLTGNAYWLLDGVKDEHSQPKAIYPLNPGYVRPKIEKLPAFISAYEYDVGSSGKKTFQPFEIIHFRRPNPDNPYIGLGPTEAAADAIDADNWAREWNRRFFQNSGHPGLVLETDQTDPQTIQLLRESFDERYAGASKSHRTAILPQGVKIASGGFAQRDMDFVELRRFARDEILAHYGVPHIALGLGAGENLNRATAETTDYVFSRRTILPKLRRFETFLNEFLTIRFGADLVLEFDDPVPQNAELRLLENEAALGRAPYKSVNEVRGEEGLQAIKGGDNIMGSTIMIPIGTVPQNTGKSGEKIGLVVKSASKSRPVKSGKAKKADRRQKLGEDLAERVAKAVNDQLAALKDENWAPRWKSLVERVTPYENDLRDKMAEYARDMGKRARISLERQAKSKTKAINTDELLVREDEVAAILNLTGPTFQDLLKAEGTNAAELIAAAFDARDQRTQRILADAMRLLGQKYTDETVAVLKDQLDQGIAEGESLPELTERIQTIEAWSEKTRAERVARTEAFRTANMATKEAWRQSGTVKSVKWYTAEDELVCPFCAPMEGKEVGIQDNFFNKGDTVLGEDAEGNAVEMTANYSAIEAPPLHPNCRCYIRPENISI